MASKVEPVVAPLYWGYRGSTSSLVTPAVDHPLQGAGHVGVAIAHGKVDDHLFTEALSRDPLQGFRLVTGVEQQG